ncbi:MAG: cytochrome B [Litoreibacter sp.]
MWEWLFFPIDAARANGAGWAVSWHARAMVLGWGVLAPCVVLIARFFKIMPGQKSPEQLDNKVWWRSHWMGQSVVLLLTLAGLALVWSPNWERMNLHQFMGYSLLIGLLLQTTLGIPRGSKGGPTDTTSNGSLRGDHYDMTQRRLMFELVHKTLGYVLLMLAAGTILVGLWDANGPRWMWLALAIWWVFYVCAFAMLQRRGMAIDTYQAIRGTDAVHPGNRRADTNWWQHTTRRR